MFTHVHQLTFTELFSWSGDVAQLVERRIGTQPTQVRFPSAARDFSVQLTFSADSYGVRTPPSAIAYINISALVKDPVVHIRVRWIKTQHVS